jgi:hypothetical protein
MSRYSPTPPETLTDPGPWVVRRDRPRADPPGQDDIFAAGADHLVPAPLATVLALAAIGLVALAGVFAGS